METKERTASDIFLAELDAIKEAGLEKQERPLRSRQSSRITASNGEKSINLCSNNYLGLSQDPRVVKAAHDGLDKWGYGLGSVRFICGTQTIHWQLEEKLSQFLKTEETILFSSCFDANTGLFETILTKEDAIISDELNHASIIDGVRLCKAARYRYRNNNLEDLEKKLIEAKDARIRLIATDGVFSMDGTIADLKGICDLADKYDALVMVDDSHAVGFIGESGRGTHELHKVEDRVDIITGTLGKALGGASGGYVSGRKDVIDLLRQRARPYLFSNSLAPPIVSASIKALEILESSTDLRNQLHSRAQHFRQAISTIGFEVLPGEHPIIPIMIREPRLAKEIADALFELGVYVTAFSFPVVPRGKDRIRTQISAGHSLNDLTAALKAFSEVYSRFSDQLASASEALDENVPTASA